MALGFMRRHRRWLFGFLWLVIIAFIILYIPAFQRDEEQGLGLTVAQVADRKITLGDYQRSYLRQREMYQSMYQGRMNDEMLRRLGLEEQALQGLVDERILVLEAERLGIRVDDETLKQRRGRPQFQRTGRSCGEEIRKRLELAGHTVREYEESSASLSASGVARDRLVHVGAAEARKEFRRRKERQGRVVVVPPTTPGSPQPKRRCVAGRVQKSLHWRSGASLRHDRRPPLASRVTSR